MSNLENAFFVIIWQFFAPIWPYLAIFGHLFGLLGFLVTLPMHFPVILTQFVAMRCKRAALKMLRGGDNFRHHGCAR
jgi:hypothetical protein